MNHSMLSEGTVSIIDFVFDVSWIVVILEKNRWDSGLNRIKLVFFSLQGVKGRMFFAKSNIPNAETNNSKPT